MGDRQQDRQRRQAPRRLWSRQAEKPRSGKEGGPQGRRSLGPPTRRGTLRFGEKSCRDPQAKCREGFEGVRFVAPFTCVHPKSRCFRMAETCVAGPVADLQSRDRQGATRGTWIASETPR